jgi:hypothetical protein
MSVGMGTNSVGDRLERQVIHIELFKLTGVCMPTGLRSGETTVTAGQVPVSMEMLGMREMVAAVDR